MSQVPGLIKPPLNMFRASARDVNGLAHVFNRVGIPVAICGQSIPFSLDERAYNEVVTCLTCLAL